MTTLHIMLASGENLPNLIPAIASLQDDAGFKADSALILTSKSMRPQAQTLKTALEYAKVRAVDIHAEDCPDHDLRQIRQWARARAEEISARRHDARRILNLTGGTKLMTIAFLEAFQPHGAETIYCDTEHSRIEYIDDSRDDPALPVNILKLDTCLAAQGYRLRATAPDSAAIGARAALTRQLVAAAPRNEHIIQALNSAWYDYNERQNLYAHVDTGKLGKNEKNLIDEIRQSGLLDANEHFRDESAACYLGGGWLEEWCWLIGKELEENVRGKRLKSDRWGIALRIDPFNAAIPTQSYSLNELDAVYVHRNRMLLIECKTGMQISEPDKSQAILNKLEALGSQFGGRLNSKWLLSARPIKSRQTKERARRYGIRLIEANELVDLKKRVMEWMTQ
ncbi:MAG: DUF1887 family protein [Azoarcus sp.]|jgi:hypothetical protein|nr:DUF1887 family protein [Azoarcus sp.]